MSLKVTFLQGKKIYEGADDYSQYISSVLLAEALATRELS